MKIQTIEDLTSLVNNIKGKHALGLTYVFIKYLTPCKEYVKKHGDEDHPELDNLNFKDKVSLAKYVERFYQKGTNHDDFIPYLTYKLYSEGYQLELGRSPSVKGRPYIKNNKKWNDAKYRQGSKKDFDLKNLNSEDTFDMIFLVTTLEKYQFPLNEEAKIKVFNGDKEVVDKIKSIFQQKSSTDIFSKLVDTKYFALPEDVTKILAKAINHEPTEYKNFLTKFFKVDGFVKKMVSFDFKKYEIKRSFVENIYKSLQKKYETIFNNKLNFEEKVDALKELIPNLIKSNDQEDYFKDLLSKLNNLPDLKTKDYKNFIRSIDAVLEKRDNKNFEELNKFLDINNFPQQDVVDAIFDSFETTALEQTQYNIQ